MRRIGCLVLGGLALCAPQGSAEPAPLETAPDLVAELILSDPQIAQPVSLKFDEGGRLWVVEYRQYPDPAGLSPVDRDEYWRIRYDAVPPPPPHPPGSPFAGRDRISIHEDADGDGRFESHQVFLDGLNLCTSIAFARDGLWVLNPPYLLFYPDNDRDDTPDGAPVVHLEGFGLEDTHSIANSLRWGPEGWLYGCNGSTVSMEVGSTLAVPRPAPVTRSGQCIWRYHPPTHRFEIFAEGGGNSFGLEIDSAGRIFSGHNGGDTRGFHFVRGGYYRKNFGKHGDLSNPHAYGWFPAMSHHEVPRFSHHFLIYEADHLPARYRSHLLALDILHNNLAMAEVSPFGSTFKTRDLERPVQGSTTFRPQHMVTGPDGALYLADWADNQVNHYRNHEGRIDRQSGRIYRLRAKGETPAILPIKADPVSLLVELGSPNRTRRQTALRLIRETQPLAIEDSLLARLRPEAPSPHALDGLWALHALGRLTPELLLETARHPSPNVARWSFRLMDECGWLERPEVRDAFLEAVRTSEDSELLAELLATGRDLAGPEALALAEAFVTRKRFDDDPHLPLLTWWLLEEATRDEPAELLRWTGNRQLWSAVLFRDILLERIARRLVDTGDEASLSACGELLDRAPDDWSRNQVIEGINRGFEGVSTPVLPGTLEKALRRQQILLPPELHLRLGFDGAVERVFTHIRRTPIQSGHLLGVLAEVHPEEALEPLLDFVTGEEPQPALLPEAIRCLQSFEGDIVAERLLMALGELPPDARQAAGLTLASRPSWSRLAMEAIESGQVPASRFEPEAVQRMQLHANPRINGLITRHFPGMASAAGPVDGELRRLSVTLKAGGRGNLERGKELFAGRCGACHRLFDQGRDIGPDLTSYQRADLQSLLLAILAPGAEIREGYETATVYLEDQSIVAGLLRRQNPKIVEVMDLTGNRRIIPRDEVRRLEIVPSSLMPAGLLDGLDDRELRDLFAFLTQVR
jgi:putative membrane-bound dehydrogenase-like protein